MVAESTWLPKAPVGKASRRVLLGRLYPRGQIPDPESVVTRLSVPMVDANVLRSRQGGADARTQEGPTRAGRRVRRCRPRAGVAARLSRGASLSDVRAAGRGLRHSHPRCAPRQKAADQTLVSPPELRDAGFLFLFADHRERRLFRALPSRRHTRADRFAELEAA